MRILLGSPNGLPSVHGVGLSNLGKNPLTSPIAFIDNGDKALSAGDTFIIQGNKIGAKDGDEFELIYKLTGDSIGTAQLTAIQAPS